MKTRPMSSAPKDGTTILAWHCMWDCWISVSWIDHCWVESTKSTDWPDRFLTHWRKPPRKPQGKQ